MRTRLVVWGTNNKDERVLLGISLNPDENKINLVAIPSKDCTEEFYNKMLSQWREGIDLELPASTEKRSLELTMSDSILPEDFRVERSDMIQRAQMEWHFLVLSTKLYRNFKSELEDMGNKIKSLDNYEKSVWDELKGLWDGIQKHIFDRNILRDHSDSLREKSNALFEELKKLRSLVEAEVSEKSTAILNAFNSKLEEINQRLESGGVIKLIFDDLKKIQEEFKSKTLVREDRNKLIKKLDEAFNAVREKRNSHSASKEDSDTQGTSGALSRMSSRMKGLEDALRKIEKSIEYDQKDIDFENKRIQSSQGQLEAQIRVAKIKMIEDRIKSKKEKLDELNKIKLTLEKTSDSLKKKEEKRLKKQEENFHRKEEVEKVRARFEEEIQAKQAEHIEDHEKLEKAAEEIKQSKRPRRSSTKPSYIETELIEQVPETISNTNSEEINLEEEKQEIDKISESLDELIETALEDDNNAPSDETQAPDASSENES